MDITVCMAMKTDLEKKLFIAKSEIQSLQARVASLEVELRKSETELNNVRVTLENNIGY